MSIPENDRRIDYIEIPVTDMKKTKKFYNKVFGWEFEDFGPDYTSFNDGRLAGGFFTTPDVRTGGPMVIMYSTDLEGMQKKVTAAGGKITKPPFDFPGGRRFQFTDPSGHELAVWTNI
jgi:predicted enzyme related to lactoylglutathione lyase